MIFNWIKGNKVYTPSWIIIWISLFLLAVVIFMGVEKYHHEKDYTGLILKEKGAALIWALEAVTQTEVKGIFGNDAHSQTLLEETITRLNIAYIALVDRSGMILAHSDKNMIGQTSKAFVFNSSFSPTDDPQWRIVEGKNKESSFEVYKNLSAVTLTTKNMEQKSGAQYLKPDQEHQAAIIIGMDITPFQEAMSEDLWHNVLMAWLTILLACTGAISFFWIQNYLSSRKLLQDIRAFASVIIRNLPVGMVVVSNDGKIRFINDVACSLLAIQSKKAEECVAQDILPASLMSLHEKISRKKLVIEKELNLIGTGKASIPVNVSTTDIVGEEGQYIGFMFILQDLSEIRQLEIKIRQREKLAAIGDLAAGIAHEVRNPLSSIKGYATYFGSFFEEGSENHKAAGIMAEEVDRVNRVISELLEFARPSDLNFIKTDIRKLIEHTLSIITHEASYAGVTIIKKFDYGLPELIIDPDRITQVILNILINAIQAMEHGGTLTVGVKQETHTLVINISDTGKGIPPEDQAKIFNPYFTTKKNGTGLGLAIIHKIVENHGGTIQIQSMLEIGTSVSIILPVQPAEGI
jgi:two-component system sensor histidine kinase HydH